MIYPGPVHALQDIDLDFPAGQLTSLLGPSGCGKTTLLKIIAGLLTPASGTVMVNGKKVEGPGPERAFVFQDFALLPWANVIRNVAFGLELRGVAALRARGHRREIYRRSRPEAASSRNIRMSFRAACASASGSRARCRCKPTCC